MENVLHVGRVIPYIHVSTEILSALPSEKPNVLKMFVKLLLPANCALILQMPLIILCMMFSLFLQ